MDPLNYHHLLNFWQVSREGSIQRASEVLGVTPASVSIQVSRLERELGVKLLARRGRGIILTELGQQVAEYATEIFSTGRELLEQVQGRTAGRQRELRIGVLDAMPKLLAFQLLEPALTAAADPWRLICYEGEMTQLVADLAVYKVDVVLSDAPLEASFKLRAYSHLLGESDLVVLGAPALVEQYRTNFPLSLSGAPLLLPTSTCGLRRTVDHWLSEHGLTPQIRGEFADSAMLKIAAQRGLGLFMAPAAIAAEVSAMYRVESLGVLAGLRERYYAITLERKLKHPAVIAIRNSAANRQPPPAAST